MIVIIILIYLGAVYGAFRVFKIPLKPFPISVAILIGIGVIGSVLIGWQGGAPISKQITLMRPIVDINSQLKGLVKEVYFPIGAKIKAGETVFEIDPEPFEAALELAKANRENAQAQVGLAEAGIEVATANVDRTKADAALAESEMKRSDQLAARGSTAISELEVEQRRFAFDSAKAGVAQTEAARRQAEASLKAAKQSVAAADESVRSATFNLNQTSWEAPTDGVLINWVAQKNTITTALHASSIGTFMQMEFSRVVAILPQNLMRKVAVGDPVELAFLSRPGTIDSGKVIRIANYTAEGQFRVSSNVPRMPDIGSKGMIAAIIELDDPQLANTLSLGEAGAAAIYTRPAGPFHIVSKLTLRITSLMYLLP